MSAALQQIRVAYEVNGMTPEEIAEDQNFELATVKAALMNTSSKYRKSCGLDEDTNGLDFTDEELRAVNRVIFEASQCAELPDGSIDWKTRSQNAQYIRDDKKGRKEVRKQMQGNTFNVLMFNEQLQKARELSASVKRQLIEA